MSYANTFTKEWASTEKISTLMPTQVFVHTKRCWWVECTKHTFEHNLNWMMKVFHQSTVKQNLATNFIHVIHFIMHMRMLWSCSSHVVAACYQGREANAPANGVWSCMSTLYSLPFSVSVATVSYMRWKSTATIQLRLLFHDSLLWLTAVHVGDSVRIMHLGINEWLCLPSSMSDEVLLGKGLIRLWVECWMISRRILLAICTCLVDLGTNNGLRRVGSKLNMCCGCVYRQWHSGLPCLTCEKQRWLGNSSCFPLPWYL